MATDTESQDAGLLLETIEGVCQLVMLHEHVARTDAGSDLHTVLAANVEDSCHWVSYNFLNIIIPQNNPELEVVADWESNLLLLVWI